MIYTGLIVATLARIGASVPAPHVTSPPSLEDAVVLPEHCTTVFVNTILETTWEVSQQWCYTHTLPADNVRCPCPSDRSIMCPMYIVMKTIDIPCQTDCCPSTATVDPVCPECVACKNTQTVYRYEECAATPIVQTGPKITRTVTRDPSTTTTTAEAAEETNELDDEAGDGWVP